MGDVIVHGPATTKFLQLTHVDDGVDVELGWVRDKFGQFGTHNKDFTKGAASEVATQTGGGFAKAPSTSGAKPLKAPLPGRAGRHGMYAAPGKENEMTSTDARAAIKRYDDQRKKMRPADPKKLAALRSTRIVKAPPRQSAAHLRESRVPRRVMHSYA